MNAPKGSAMTESLLVGLMIGVTLLWAFKKGLPEILFGLMKGIVIMEGYSEW